MIDGEIVVKGDLAIDKNPIRHFADEYTIQNLSITIMKKKTSGSVFSSAVLFYEYDIAFRSTLIL